MNYNYHFIANAHSDAKVTSDETANVYGFDTGSYIQNGIDFGFESFLKNDAKRLHYFF
jgi:hypothetical protein